MVEARFLFVVWRVRPSEWCFSTMSPRAGFFYISLCENSINQSDSVPVDVTTQSNTTMCGSVRRLKPTECHMYLDDKQ